MKRNLFLLALLLSGCHAALDRKAYVSWVTDYKNGLHVSKQEGDYLFDLQYQPGDYVRLVRNNPSLDDSLEYFTLQIHLQDSDKDFLSHGISTSEEKQQRLYYFSYVFQEAISLEDGGKRYPCVLFHFEQGGFSNRRTFLLAFEKNHHASSAQSTIIIDSPLLSSLPIFITINKANIPSLIL